MAPPTVLDSLELKVSVPMPIYPNPFGHQDASELGESTKKAKAPHFAVGLPKQHWLNNAREFLNDIEKAVRAAKNNAYKGAAQQAQLAGKNKVDQDKEGRLAAGRIRNKLEDEHISLKEDSMYHASEADVVRAAGIYLMHPVGQALNFHQNLARSITIQSEFQKSRMRTDIAYFKSPNRQGNPGRAFAVIEFKKRGVLSNAQFAAATKPVDTTNPAQVKQAVDAAMKRPPVGGDRSFFERSSLKCIKQVAAYALNNKIQYAALFDWDVLVLVRFSQHNIGPQPGNVNPSVGNWCELTVFTTAESHLMRPALLGFLAEAYVKTPY